MKNVTKSISFILAIILCVSLYTPAFAVRENNDELEAYISELEESLPNAEIYIVDKTIHVVVNDMADVPELQPMLARTTTIVSANGGTYRNFKTPILAGFIPLAQVYANSDITESALITMGQPKVAEYILGALAAGKAPDIVAAGVKAAFGITLKVSVVASFVLIDGIAKNVEYNALRDARDLSSTGKVMVVRGLIPVDGYTTCYYSPWENNVCSSYAGYDATWHAGVYDLDHT